MLKERSTSISARIYRDVKRVYSQVAHAPQHIYVRYFIVIALVAGMCFVFLTPPLQGTDEMDHFFRAYQASQGNAVADYTPNGIGGIYYNSLRNGKKPSLVVGGQVPSGLVTLARDASERLPQHPAQKMKNADWKEMASVRWDGKTVPVNFIGAAVYSPVAYIPDMVGIWTARLIGVRPLIMMYMVRLSALVFGVALIALGIYLIPFAKLPFTILALWPMTLFQLSTITADTTAIALSFLAVALILRVVRQSTNITWRTTAALVVVLGSLALTKPTLFLISLLCLGFLMNKNITRKSAYISIFITVLVSFTLAITWNSIIKDRISYGFSQAFPANSYSRQLHGIITRPLYFSYVMYESVFTTNFDRNVSSAVGDVGWLDTPLPLGAVICGYMLLATTVFASSQSEDVEIKRWYKVVLISVGVLVIFLSLLALYLFQTPVGYYRVLGTQGRYLIPAILVTMLAFLGGKKVFSAKHYQKLAKASLRVSAVLLASMIIIEAIRFYPISTAIRSYLKF